MTRKWPLVPFAIIAMVQFSPAAHAIECPQYLDDAQAAIDKVTEDMKGMEGVMAKEDMALPHALLDDAKMLLAGAVHNHEKPQGDYDIARCIAKASAARGFAEAADILHFEMMQKVK